jgi:hypothetical protein
MELSDLVVLCYCNVYDVNYLCYGCGYELWFDVMIGTLHWRRNPFVDWIRFPNRNSADIDTIRYSVCCSLFMGWRFHNNNYCRFIVANILKWISDSSPTLIIIFCLAIHRWWYALLFFFVVVCGAVQWAGGWCVVASLVVPSFTHQRE